MVKLKVILSPVQVPEINNVGSKTTGRIAREERDLEAVPESGMSRPRDALVA